MDQLDLDPKAEQDLARLQDTKLNAMEEALFQAWTKANQIEDPDAPDDSNDYRGIWKNTQGQVLPRGELKNMTDTMNLENSLQKALQQRMIDRVNELAGKEEDFAKAKFDAEQAGVKHGHKMEEGKLKLKQAPFDLKMRESDIQGKKLDIDKQKIGLDAQKLGNQGKEIDLIASLMAPAPSTQPAKPTPKPTQNK